MPLHRPTSMPAIARTAAILTVALMAAVTTNTVSAAAGGPSLQLGRTTVEHHTSTLKNAGSGPALSLKSKPTSAPLAVSNGRLVKRLNADKLDGLDAASLGVHTFTYSLDGLSTSSGLLDTTLPALRGTYLVSFYVTLSNTLGSAGAPRQATCELFDTSENLVRSTAVSTSSGYPPSLNGTAVVTDPAHTTLRCAHDVSNEFDYTDGSRLTFVAVQSATRGADPALQGSAAHR